MKANKHFFIYRSILLRMGNISDKSCRENQNTHLTANSFFFLIKTNQMHCFKIIKF
jgi:hypothetical protein